MGISNFSVFTAFRARDGVSPVFKAMTTKGNAAGIRIARGMDKAKAAIVSVKNAAVVAAGAVAAVGAFAPLKAFADWEKGIKTVYTLLSKDEIKQYGGTLEELSKQGIRSGLAVEDVNKALFNAVSAMGMNDKTIEVYNKSLVLSKAGAADLSTSLSGMMAVINAWGAETTDATGVANAFFTAQKNGVTTVQELAENVGSVAPIAKAMGLSFEETAASIAALTKGGLSTDAATTGLRATLTALAKPSTEAEETLSAFGVPVGIAQVKAKGLTYTLQKLIELQKKSPDAITKAIPNVKALTGVLAMDESKMQEVHKTLGMIQQDIKNGTGLNEAFDMMNSANAMTMAQVVGELQVALIELGKVAAPYLMPLVKSFGEMVKQFENLTPKIDIVLNALSGLCDFIKEIFLPAIGFLAGAGGVLAIKKAFDLTSQAITFFRTTALIQTSQGFVAMGGFTKIGYILTTSIKTMTKAIWLQNKAWLASPWTWIAVGIGLIIAGAILLWKNWDKVTEFVTKMWQKTKEVLSGLWQKCKNVFSSIGNFIKTHFVDFLLMALGPVGLIVRAITKISDGVRGMTKGGKGIKLSVGNGGDTPKEQPKVKNNPQKGAVDVNVNLSNKTDKDASVTTRIESSNDLQLNAA